MARRSCVLGLGWPVGLRLGLGTLLGLLGGVGCGGSPPVEEPRSTAGTRTEWLEGAWVASAQGVTELWAREGDVVYGASASDRGIELLRLDADALLAAPVGSAPIRFPVRVRDERSFEAALEGHDPEWIRYVREGPDLVASIGVAGDTHAQWRFSAEPRVAGRDLPFFGTAEVRVELVEGAEGDASDEVWLTLPPCVCAPIVRCVGVRDGARLELFAGLFDRPCEACQSARVQCEIADAAGFGPTPGPGGTAPSEVTVGGLAIRRDETGSALRTASASPRTFVGTGRLFATLR